MAPSDPVVVDVVVVEVVAPAPAVATRWPACSAGAEEISGGAGRAARI